VEAHEEEAGEEAGGERHGLDMAQPLVNPARFELDGGALPPRSADRYRVGQGRRRPEDQREEVEA